MLPLKHEISEGSLQYFLHSFFALRAYPPSDWQSNYCALKVTFNKLSLHSCATNLIPVGLGSFVLFYFQFLGIAFKNLNFDV